MPIEYLISKRKNTNLQVVSFFGINDKSIPEDDRLKTKEQFIQNEINYQDYEYNAGHAYFQEGRKNYDAISSTASWEVLRQQLK